MLSTLLLLIGLFWPDKYLHIIFCDVGQGDAILIQRGFSQLLVDTGANDQLLSCLNEYLPKWDRNIEFVVITHDDDDHIGGLEAVLGNYQVNELLIERLDKIEGLNLGNWDDDNQPKSLPKLKKPLFGQKIIFPDVFEAQVLSHLSSYFEQNPVLKTISAETSLSDADLFFLKQNKDNNDRSIVLFLQVGQFKILLMGDMSQGGELALMNKNLLAKTNILKVGHHGSKTSSSEQFLQSIKPEIAIISSGKNNQFGHPHPQVIANLEQIGAKILQTSELGNIELIIADENFWWKQ